jgi:predicted DNA-binding transcriptional regulator AlpA
VNDNSIRLVRFADLKDAGIVRNWPQLGRLIERDAFPKGFNLSANNRVWEKAEVDAWISSRKALSEIRQTEAA